MRLREILKTIIKSYRKIEDILKIIIFILILLWLNVTFGMTRALLESRDHQGKLL